MSITVDLRPELEEFIKMKIESGRYDSASQVVEEALRILEKEEHFRNESREEIRQKIAEGIEDLKQGRKAPLDEVMLEGIKRRGRERLEALSLINK
jgi:antitoxin ParD1/3/4